jgi:hypothetical protein
MEQRMARGAGALALALALACGGSESAPPQQNSMVPGKRTEAAGRAGNRAPVVSRVRLAPRDPKPGDSIEAQVDANDPDGDTLRLTYRWLVNGRPVAASGATLPAGMADRDDRVEVSVVANDGALDSQEGRARLTVEPSAPQIRQVAFDPFENVRPGDTVTALVDAQAADDANLRLDYRWLVNGEETREHGRTFDTAKLRRGDRVQVKVTAYDDDVASDPVTSDNLVLVNSPPAIAGIPKAEREGDAFRYHFEATDPDGDHSLRWSLTEAPPGMTIDPIYGVATWRPTKDQAGDQTIEVQVTDNHGDGSKLRFQVKVTATETPAPGAAGKGAAAPPAPAAPAASE